MKKSLLLICFALLSTMFFPKHVLAFSVSPAILEIEGQRGETVSSSITIINESSVDEEYFIGSMNFEAQDQSGAPEFIPYNIDHSGLPDWFSFQSDSFLVPARSYVEMPFEIVTPDDVAAGSYHSAITVSMTPSEVVEANGAVMQATIASLVFFTVVGETTESAALLSFTSETDDKLASTLPSDVQIKLQNQGNVYLSPYGAVSIKDIFGRTLAIKEVNQEEGRVLPLTTRIFLISFSEADSFAEKVVDQAKMFSIGPLTVELDLRYSEDDQIQSSFQMWYFPWQLLSTVFGGIILLIGGFRVLFKRSQKSSS